MALLAHLIVPSQSSMVRDGAIVAVNILLVSGSLHLVLVSYLPSLQIKKKKLTFSPDKGAHRHKTCQTLQDLKDAPLVEMLCQCRMGTHLCTVIG